MKNTTPGGEGWVYGGLGGRCSILYMIRTMFDVLQENTVKIGFDLLDESTRARISKVLRTLKNRFEKMPFQQRRNENRTISVRFPVLKAINQWLFLEPPNIRKEMRINASLHVPLFWPEAP